MDKTTTAEKAVLKIKNGDVILIGGYYGISLPDTILAALLERDITGLTLAGNDIGGTGNIPHLMIEKGMVSRIRAGYIGNNPLACAMMRNDPDSVEMIPQGNLAERLRAAGTGLGGILTPVGLGTIVENGKHKVEIDGRTYLFEPPFFADAAFVHATKADRAGNCFMKGTTKNFNAVMPQAARYVVVEAEEIVEPGDIDPELITVPGVFVDAVIPVKER